jgi:hypothetical protein
MFQQTTQLPLSLTQGDTLQKLDELQAMHSDDLDLVSRKIKFLLDIQFPRSRIVRAISLLRELPGTTDLVEQNHAAAAVLLRQHDTYCLSTLCARSLVRQFRDLIGPNKSDRGRQQIMCRIDKLTAKLKTKLTGHNMFMTASSRRARRLGDVSGAGAFNNQQEVVRTFSADYLALPLGRRLRYEKLAVNATKHRVTAAEQAIEQLRGELRLHDARRGQEDLCVGVLNHSDSFRFSADDLQRICEQFHDSSHEISIARLKERQHVAPMEPSIEEQNVVIALEAHDAERRVALAWWMRYMCNFRDHFVNTAVAKQIDAAGGDTIYMALVIKANPHNKIVFIRLHEVISPSVAVDAALSRVKNKPQHQKVFSIGDCKFFANDSVPIGGDDDVWVYRNLHLDGDIVISNHAPEPFETYVAHLPLSARAAAPPSSPRAKRAKIAAGDVDKLLVEFPWLTRDDLQPPIGAGRAAGAAARAARPGAEEAADAAPAEEPPEPVLAVAADEDEVWEELAALREEFHNPEEAVMQFYTRIQGGAWTAAHHMVVANGVSMYARAGLAKTWAKKYKWPMMKSYAYLKYGQVSAHQLASEMVRRSQHFYMLWESSENDAFVYSVEDLKSYEVSLEWVTFLTEQPVAGVIFEQGILINALVPQNPP